MGLKKLANKVAVYKERFEQGKVDKIKPDHVLKVLKKLKAKKADLVEANSAAATDEKKKRLDRKLKIADEQIARAEVLLREFSDQTADTQSG